MVSRLLLMTVVLCCFPAAFADEAAPQLIRGKFEYRGQFQVEGKRHHEIVEVTSDDQMQKVRNLIADGYDCYARPPRHYLCSKRVAFDPQDARAKARLDRMFTGYTVEYYEPGVPHLDINGEVYKQWSVPQKVIVRDTRSGTLNERIFSVVDYVWAHGFDKAYPGGTANSAQDMHRPAERGVSIPETWHEFTSETQSDSYFTSVLIERVSP